MMDMPDTETVCVCVCVRTHLYGYLTMLHPVAELCNLFSLVYFIAFILVQRTCLLRKHAHTSTLQTLAGGNSQADVLSPRFISHPSHALSLQLCESGWEGPERDQSIRLL